MRDGASPHAYSGLRRSSIHSTSFKNTTKIILFIYNDLVHWVGFPGGSDGKESACDVGDLGSIPGLGSSPGEGNGNPLQYSGLRNPMDSGAWRATVDGVEKSRAGLRDNTRAVHWVLHFKLQEHTQTLCPQFVKAATKQKVMPRDFLMVQWLRIHLAMQETQVPSLVGELRPHMLQSNKAQAPQLLSPRTKTRESMGKGKTPNDMTKITCATTKIRSSQ